MRNIKPAILADFKARVEAEGLSIVGVVEALISFYAYQPDRIRVVRVKKARPGCQE